MSPNLEIIVGTYEQFLLGYTVDDVVNKYKMEQSFAMHSHLASIRGVASNKHYLASAAADDTVCLFDLHTRTESGKLIHHNDTVNSIAFTPDASHVITVSGDGTIGIVRCGNWQLEKHLLKPHKGLSVDTLAIHPSGKIAMTTGHDGVLRTWNLIKGRQAYATNLIPRWKLDAKNISVLKWNFSGNSFLIAASNKVDIYSVATAGVEEELNFDSKIVCVEYLSDEYFAVGLADGTINIYDIKNKINSIIQAHSSRVKCMSVSGELLVSGSSSGEIKLWSVNANKLKFLNKIDCSCRISCLTLTSCVYLKKKKDESDNDTKIIEKNINKLRLKQQVIVQEEEDEELQVISPKKSKNKRKAEVAIQDNKKELIEEVTAKNFNDKKRKKSNKVLKVEEETKYDEKKIKLNLLKKKLDLVPNDSNNTKKKKKMANDRKRKETSKLIQDNLDQKKIKLDNFSKSDETFDDKKKKNVTISNTMKNLAKKYKTVNLSTENILSKKKKKKNFKNKVF